MKTLPSSRKPHEDYLATQVSKQAIIAAEATTMKFVPSEYQSPGAAGNIPSAREPGETWRGTRPL